MNTKKVPFGVLSFLLVLSVILAACAPAAPVAAPAAPTAAPVAAKGHHIALVQFLKGHPVHRLMQLGFQDGCKARGYDCEMLLTDSTNGVEMIPLAEQALAEPVDGIVFYAYDNSFFPTIKKFKDAGIPIVTPHFTSFKQEESGLTAVVGADVVQYAKAAADAMGEKLAGKGSVAVTVGGFNETENLVAKTFKEEMAAKYAAVKVLDPQEEGFDQAQAIAKAVAIIQGNPDIAGAFSTTGNGPTTWSTAAAEASRSDLIIISMDYTRPNLDLVKSGKVYGLVAQPLYDEFYKAAELVGDAIDGKAIEYKNLLPAPIVLLKDIGKYYEFNDRAEAGITGAAAPTAAPVAAKGHHIALVQFLKGHPVHRLMQLGFQDGCKARGYDCEMLLTDSTNGVEMIPLAEQALAEPVDGIVFYAYDNSFFPTIKKFKNAGIPIVTPHFTSFKQEESGLTAVVGADVVQYAKAAADAMGEKLAGKGSVAVTVGGFNETENLVAKTFKEEMAAKYAAVKVLDPQEEGFDQAQAIAKAVAIIQGNPDIAGAFSTTGNGPTTWSTAAAEASKSDLVIISMDYTRPNLDLVKSGKVYGLVAQPLYDEFYKAAELVGDAIDGKAIEYKNLLPAPIVLLKDIGKYYEFNDRAEAGIAGTKPVESGKAWKIALVQFLKGHPVHRLMQLGFQDACKAKGYNCEMLLTDSTNGVEMIPLAEQALAEPVDGIVFYAYDNSFFPTIKKFKDAGIPIVTPHFTSFKQEESGLTAVVGADVVQYAKAAAEAIGAKVSGKKGSVAITVGGFNETENLVAKTFKATMNEKYPDIKVLDAQEEGFDQAQAIAKAVAIIQGNPDIVAAFSTTGNGPTTWATAAADASKSDLVIISMDYTRPNLDLVKSGKVYGLVAQPLYEEFYKAVELVGAALDGQTVQYLNLLPAPVIFSKDIDKYFEFNTRAEAGINK